MRLKSIQRCVYVITLLGLLTHCATTPTLPASDFSWQISGKIAVKNEATGTGESGYLRWQQSGDHYDIEVMGPLGLGAKRLIGDTKTATLLNTLGHTLTKGSPEALMQHYFGWSLPTQAFYDWSRGQPYRNAPFHIEKKRNGRISQLTQLGWHLQFEQFEPEGPTRLTFIKPPLRIRVFIQARHF